MNYFTFEITKIKGTRDTPNYETGWYISYPKGFYTKKSLKKIRREVKEYYETHLTPVYMSGSLTLADIKNASVFERRALKTP